MLLRLLFKVPLGWFFHTLFWLIDYILFPSLWFKKVEAPVFIVGHARSGTTLMHRLMAADQQRFSYFLYWETFVPSITLKKMVRLLSMLDKTLLRGFINAKLAAWDEKNFGPWRHIHNQGLWISEEDQFVMRAAFVTQQWALDAPLMDKVDIFHVDEMPADKRKCWMRYYKACVKRQLIYSGKTTHLSKNPVMSGWVESIIETFPDARIVVMMRDPSQCMPSTLKLVELTWQAKGWSKEQYAVSQQALTNISFDTYTHPKAVLAKYPSTKQIVVDYRDITSAPKACVTNVFDALNLPITADYDAYLSKHEEKAKNHQSKFEYDMGDYELSHQRIEDELAEFYQQYQWPQYGDNKAE